MKAQVDPSGQIGRPEPPRPDFPNSLEAISKHFKPVKALKTIRGPLSLRALLSDSRGKPVSQDKIGVLLSRYAGRSYSRSTICLWERVEHGKRLRAKYAMTARARTAYRDLISDLVRLASDGRWRVRARLGRRVWRFEVMGGCPRCRRPFPVGHPRTVLCKRCRRGGNRK